MKNTSTNAPESFVNGIWPIIFFASSESSADTMEIHSIILYGGSLV